MAKQDDYDPYLSGDIVQATKARKTSFDMTNSPEYLRAQQAAQPAQQAAAGPVSRAAQQITPAASQGPIPSMMSINPMPSRSTQAQRATSLSSALPAAPTERQTSFDQTNSARYLGGGAGQGPGPETRRASNFTGSLSDFPVGPTTQYRGTGVGEGANQIAMRLENGVPEFSNQPKAREQATSLGNIAMRPAAQQLDPNANSLESLGTARNIGDGVGSFSQAQAGDAALAMGRWDRASQIRQETLDQQRVNRALANQSSLDNLTIVADSSRIPRNRVEARAADQAAQRDEATKRASLDQVGVARTAQADSALHRATQQDIRRAARLEDIQVRAYSPSATQADRNSLAALLDPTGKDRAAVELSVARADQARAAAEKDRREGGAGNIKLTEQQGKDLQYHDRANAANGELATNGMALTSAAIGERGSSRALTDAFVRGVPLLGGTSLANSLVSNERQLAEQAGREFVNSILRKDSGAALTPDEISTYGVTYLPQVGDGEAVLKQKEQARSRAVEGIKKGLGPAQILATATIKPEEARQNASAAKSQSGIASAAMPTAMTKAEADALPPGTVFIGPNGRQYRK